MNPLSVTDIELAPYRLELPAQMSFSGGRTSGYLLERVLRAFGGKLPPEVKVTFFNTGKERAETLEFVHEVEQRWGVPIVWLEYRNEHLPHRPQDERVSEYVARVTFETAHRDGEPFDALIKSRAYLPNPVARYCTKELKLRCGRDFMRSIGCQRWNVAVGIRADEPQRFTSNPGMYVGERCLPLVDAGVTEEDVMAFWADSRGGMPLREWLAIPAPLRPGLDLPLLQEEGNCDLCFLKSRQKIARLVTQRPRSALWWMDQEQRMKERGGMSVFREDRPDYAYFHEMATTGGPLFAVADDGIDDCNCTD